MRISKPGKNGGNQGITQVVGSAFGGVVIHATGKRGRVTRIYISATEMNQITAAIVEAKAAYEARQARLHKETVLQDSLHRLQHDLRAP